MKIFFILFYIINTIYGYLTKTNYYCIRNLIKNQNITITQREKVNKILYNSFEKWSMKQAYIFKKKHYYKCSRIPTDELILYSKVGLYKSILNYNGKPRLKSTWPILEWNVKPNLCFIFKVPFGRKC